MLNQATQAKCGGPCFPIYRLWRCTEYMICVQGPFSQCFWNIQFLPHLGKRRWWTSILVRRANFCHRNGRTDESHIFCVSPTFFSGIVSVKKHRKGQLYTTAFIFFDNLWFLLLNFGTKMVSPGNYNEWIRVENQWQKTVLLCLPSNPAITSSPHPLIEAI